MGSGVAGIFVAPRRHADVLRLPQLIRKVKRLRHREALRGNKRHGLSWRGSNRWAGRRIPPLEGYRSRRLRDTENRDGQATLLRSIPANETRCRGGMGSGGPPVGNFFPAVPPDSELVWYEFTDFATEGTPPALRLAARDGPKGARNRVLGTPPRAAPRLARGLPRLTRTGRTAPPHSSRKQHKVSGG